MMSKGGSSWSKFIGWLCGHSKSASRAVSPSPLSAAAPNVTGTDNANLPSESVSGILVFTTFHTILLMSFLRAPGTVDRVGSAERLSPKTARMEPGTFSTDTKWRDEEDAS
jgi:hypothetical protein